MEPLFRNKRFPLVSPYRAPYLRRYPHTQLISTLFHRLERNRFRLELRRYRYRLLRRRHLLPRYGRYLPGQDLILLDSYRKRLPLYRYLHRFAWHSILQHSYLGRWC